MESVKRDASGFISMMKAPLSLAVMGTWAAGITSPVRADDQADLAFPGVLEGLLEGLGRMPSPKKMKSGLRMPLSRGQSGGRSVRSNLLAENEFPQRGQTRRLELPWNS